MGQPEHKLLELTEWVMGMRCASHVMSGGVKTGLAELCSEMLLEQVHIVVSSLINSADSLHCHIMEYLQAHMEFDDARSGSMADIEGFWRALGVEPHLIDRIAFVDPVFQGGRLHVWCGLRDLQGGLSIVRAVVTYLFRWVKFSETR